MLDIPNERSSHKIPTPRNGGIAIAIAFLLGMLWLAMNHIISLRLALALLNGGIFVAGIGYLDDRKPVSAKSRSIVHFIAAAIALYFLGGFPSLIVGSWQINLGWFGFILAAIGIVWLINLYNFMDGIDGLAGSEAIFVSLTMGILLWTHGVHGIAWLCFFLVASVAGFLFWNWPPAKLFLGDVGSGLLGFIFAVLALATAKQNILPLLIWLTLLSVFIFDTTFTLMHRLWRGERWYVAHRDHIYQRLVHEYGFSHKKVTVGIVLFNCIILLPIAVWMIYQPVISPLLFLLLAIVFGRICFRLAKQGE
jgi:Fuc2NAc and GlcNAc transferase